MKITVTLLSSLLFFNIQTIGQNSRGASVVSSLSAEETGTNYALVVGISEYSDFADLDYADDDASLVLEFFQKHEDFKEENIEWLINDQATRFNFQSKILDFSDRAKENDKFFLYFAGHGDVAKAKDYGYLLFHKAPMEGDYALRDAISTTNLKEILSTFSNKGVKVILIVDACRSAKLSDIGTKSTLNALGEDWNNTVKLLACKPTEMAYELPKYSHGVFTYYLIDALTGAASDDDLDGFIDQSEIFDHVYFNVKSETDSKQKPEVRGEGKVVRRVPIKMDMKAIDSSDPLVMRGRGGVAGLTSEEESFIKLFQEKLDQQQILPPMYEVSQYKPVSGGFQELKVHNDITYSFDYSSGSQLVVAGSGKDKRIVIFSPNTKADQQVDYFKYVTDDIGGVMSVAISPEDQWFAYGNWVDEVRIRRFNDDTYLKKLIGHTGDVRALAISPDNRYLLSGDMSGKIIIWDIQNDFEKIQEVQAHKRRVSDLVCFSDGTWYSSSDDHYVKKWKLGHDDPEAKLMMNNTINAMEVTRDGRYLVCGSSFGDFQLWDVPNWKRIYNIKVNNNSINDLAISPDMNYVIVAGKNYVFELYEMLTGTKVANVDGSSRGITGCVFSETGSQMIVSNYAGNIGKVVIDHEASAYAYHLYDYMMADEKISGKVKKWAKNELIIALGETPNSILDAYINGEGDLPVPRDIITSIYHLDLIRDIVGNETYEQHQSLITIRLMLQGLLILAENEYSKFDQAIGYFRQVQEIDPLAIYPNNAIALVEKARNAIEKAKSSLSVAIDEIPKWTEPKGNMGKTLVLEQKYEEALLEFDKIISLRPDLAKGYLLKANLKILLGEFIDAKALFSDAVQNDPASLEALYGQGNLLLRHADYKGTSQVIAKMDELGAHGFFGPLLKSELALAKCEQHTPSTKLFNEAKKQFLEAYAINAFDREVLMQGLNLINSRVHTLDWMDADVSDIQKQLKGKDQSFSFDPEFLAHYAIAFGQGEDFFDDVFEKLGSNAACHIWKGYYYLAQDEYGKAISSLKSAKIKDPGNFQVHYFLLQALLKSDQQDAATEQFYQINQTFSQSPFENILYTRNNPDQTQNLLEDDLERYPNNYYINALWFSNTPQTSPHDLPDFYYDLFDQEPKRISTDFYETSIDGEIYFINRDFTFASKLTLEDSYLGNGVIKTIDKTTGLYGVGTMDGKEVIAKEYKGIEKVRDGVYVVDNGTYKGLFNSKGEKILAVKYESIEPFGAKLFRIRLMKKIAIYDDQGNMITPLGYYRAFETTYKKREVIAVQTPADTYYYNHDGKCLNCKKRR